MKSSYKLFAVLSAAFICTAAFAQTYDKNPKDIQMSKTVRPSGEGELGQYILTLEAYATGTSVTTITSGGEESVIPCDIVLLLDESGSMRANWFLNYTKGSQITSGFEADKVYIVNIDGKDYYMKGFYSNETYTKIEGTPGTTTTIPEHYDKAGTGLSYNTVNGNNYYVQYTNKEYYKVRVDGSDGNKNCYLSIEIPGTGIQYLNGTSFQTGKPSAKKKNDIIWTGDYYTLIPEHTETTGGTTPSIKFSDVCSVSVSGSYPNNNATPITATLEESCYVLYNGKYYKAEPVYYWWSTTPDYNLVIDLGGEKRYLNGTNTQVSRVSGKGYDSDIWTGDVYTKSGTGDITFVYSTSVPANITDGTVINPSSATVFNTNAQFVTREYIAKDAAKAFVQTVYDNNPNTGEGAERYHNVSVGWYSGSGANGWLYSDILTNLESQAIVGSFQNGIAAVAPTGTGTKVDEAMNMAYTLLNTDDVKNDGRNKIVVLFTDGEPGTSGSTFDVATARNAVQYANQIKNEFTNIYGEKEYPAEVYSIGFLDQETSAHHNSSTAGSTPYDIRRFLHYLSSNYNIGTDLGTYGFTSNFDGANGGDEAPHDYYIYSDGSNLASIFETVAASAAQGTTVKSESTALSAESTTVIDVVASDFKLPEGADEDEITAYSVRVSGYSEANGYSWNGTKTNIAKDNINVSGNTISVTGFDFTKEDTFSSDGTSIESYGNWVGSREIKEGGVDKTVYQGEKLVIEIPIVVNQASYQGGYNTPTNTANSSIVKDYQKEGEKEVAWFPVPKVDFPCLAIAKAGLEDGESATFKVERMVNGAYTTVYNVILTQGMNKTYTYDGRDYEYVVLKDIPDGTYRVTESNWSWTYSIDGDKSISVESLVPEKLEGSELDAPVWTVEDTKGIDRQIVAFTFSNSKKTAALPKNAEDSVENKMYVESSTPGTEGSTETGGNTGEPELP